MLSSFLYNLLSGKKQILEKNFQSKSFSNQIVNKAFNLLSVDIVEMIVPWKENTSMKITRTYLKITPKAWVRQRTS